MKILAIVPGLILSIAFGLMILFVFLIMSEEIACYGGLELMILIVAGTCGYLVT